MRKCAEAGLFDTAPNDGVAMVRQASVEIPRWIRIKSAIDPVIATSILIFIAPVVAVIWLLTRLDGGPSFYAHTRVSRNGRKFGCLKFRTMVIDSADRLDRCLAENPAMRLEWETTCKLRNDPRVTRIGRILRATSLDELPQLLNVIRGDMSLVGPRPVVDTELARFYPPEERAAYLSVRPGLTGLWQVSGRSDVDYVRRVELDAQYVRGSSLALDTKILILTVGIVLLQKGAR